MNDVTFERTLKAVAVVLVSAFVLFLIGLMAVELRHQITAKPNNELKSKSGNQEAGPPKSLRESKE